MTVQGKGAASRPCKRPKTLWPILEQYHAFILAINIPAGGSGLLNQCSAGYSR